MKWYNCSFFRRLTDTLIGALAFTDTGLASMVQNGIIVHFLDGHMDWCTGF